MASRRLTFVLIGYWQRWECSRCTAMVFDDHIEAHARSHGAGRWTVLGSL